MGKSLDVITIGRSSVDLYGQQIGSRLEDIGTFTKGRRRLPGEHRGRTARLGLKSGLITRVGAEQMGRLHLRAVGARGRRDRGRARRQGAAHRAGAAAVEDEGVSPMIFYRENCADMALDEGDVSEDLIAATRPIVVTGTHFSRPNSDAAQRKAIRLAKAAGAKVVFDVDYRPNLWGLAATTPASSAT